MSIRVLGPDGKVQELPVAALPEPNADGVAAEAPPAITRYQLRRWLRVRHGVAWEQLLAAAARMPEKDRADVLEWLECGESVERKDPRVRAMALLLPLGLTEDTVDRALEDAWREAVQPQDEGRGVAKL